MTYTHSHSQNVKNTTNLLSSERRASIGGAPSPATRLPSLRDSGGLRLSLKCGEKEKEKKETQASAQSDSHPAESPDTSDKDSQRPVQTANGSIESETD